jgi:hypothetical protein
MTIATQSLSEEQTWNSESSLALGISDRRLQIPYFWNLRFAICNPEGHVFAAEGLFLRMTSRSTVESGFNKYELAMPNSISPL